MSTKTFAARLAALEALEAAQRPNAAYVCLHAADYAALDDVTTPAELRQAIVDTYQLSGTQKWYVGLCLCWDGEACRVCGDAPVVGEMKV